MRSMEYLSDHALGDILDEPAALVVDIPYDEAALVAAIFFPDGDIVGDINKTAGEVTRVCRFDSGVRAAFTTPCDG